MDKNIKNNQKLSFLVPSGNGGTKVIIVDDTSVSVEGTKLIFTDNTQQNNG